MKTPLFLLALMEKTFHCHKQATHHQICNGDQHKGKAGLIFDIVVLIMKPNSKCPCQIVRVTRNWNANLRFCKLFFLFGIASQESSVKTSHGMTRVANVKNCKQCGIGSQSAKHWGKQASSFGCFGSPQKCKSAMIWGKN